ncbi:phenoloxidase-activating enzyme [Amyelois transitella]|uniref:phenoloxidase-activating enzyme n=1 Tax=Amyelois transitella TaxID=680683 RepID=UPI00298F619D|nr:phenoloxidase-activating enzyme [Amyelois transitella]
MKLVVSVLYVIASSSLVRGQSCNPPGGGVGECISILRCPSLAALVSKPTRTQEEVNLLRGASCGFERTTPKVCCPATCSTPEGMEGQCVDIYQCGHLASMLKPPVPMEVKQYVQKFRCNGPSRYSVCCGPAPTTPASGVEVGNCENRVFALPPDPRTRCCGVDSNGANKPIRGDIDKAEINEYPWLVIIEYSKDNKIKLLCGGTLISSRYVLTAGHCVSGKILALGTPKNVRLGEYDTTNDGQDCVDVGGGQDCNDPVLIVPIERYFSHPEYNLWSKKNDIALIRLRQNAPFTDFIRPLCLPTTDVAGRSSSFNMTTAGWGAVDDDIVSSSAIKLHVQLPFVEIQQCQAALTKLRPPPNLWEKQICAGGQKDRGSCKGDSGGPLMLENVDERRYELVGVISFVSLPCGVENIPGVYTKVFAYKSWINSAIQKDASNS